MFWKNKKKQIILCNSWPKSGTHLLLKMAATILDNNGKWYEDGAIKSRPDKTDALFEIINKRLKIHSNSFAMKGHVGYSEEIYDFLKSKEIKIFFIIRDPRDVVCSTVRWVTDLRKNWPANDLFNNISKEEQLSYAINGMPNLSPFSDNDSFVLWEKPILERYMYLTPWAEHEDVCFLKYEELSGNHGQELFNKSIAKIIDFMSIEDESIIKKLNKGFVDKGSKTFHSGNSGGWQDEFSERNIKEFIESGGEELVKKFNYIPTI